MIAPHAINAPNDIMTALPMKTSTAKKMISAVRAIAHLDLCPHTYHILCLEAASPVSPLSTARATNR
jgi:hypothetical protein